MPWKQEAQSRHASSIARKKVQVKVELASAAAQKTQQRVSLPRKQLLQCGETARRLAAAAAASSKEGAKRQNRQLSPAAENATLLPRMLLPVSMTVTASGGASHSNYQRQ
jgi:hypothetical protein